MAETREPLTPHELGAMGEVRAEQYLTGLGWQILEHNYKAWETEIDLIALDGRCVVFVEVKVRNHSHMAARETVTLSKQQRISKGALQYLRRKGMMDRQARFDVIEIQDGHLSHIRDAFPYRGRAF